MARGATFGCLKKMRPDHAELARQLVLEGKSISAVAMTFNVHLAFISVSSQTPPFDSFLFRSTARPKIGERLGS